MQDDLCRKQSPLLGVQTGEGQAALWGVHRVTARIRRNWDLLGLWHAAPLQDMI